MSRRRQWRTLGAGLESLESRLPLTGNATGLLADAACVVVDQPVSASTDGTTAAQISLLTEVDDGIFFAAGPTVWKSDSAGESVPIKGVPGTITSGTALDNNFLFTVNAGEGFSGTDQVELWFSDGTTDGTTKLRELGPWDFFGNNVQVDYLDVDGMQLLTVTQQLESDTVASLWTSDGTVAGTAPYAEGFTGVLENAIHDLAELNGDYFFTSRRGIDSPLNLWKTDPVAKTVESIKSFNEPSVADFDTGIFSVATTVGDSLYFRANDGISDYELWTSDGTEAGTRLVRDINPNASSDPTIPGGSSATVLADVNGNAYFLANDGTGSGLWRTDGTTENTEKVSEVEGTVEGAVALGDTLYYATGGNNTLWAANATGNSMVTDLPGRPIRATDEFETFIAVGERFLFSLDDGQNGAELWISDGSVEGTALAVDANSAPGASSTPLHLTASDEQLLFLANDGDGIDIWSLDLQSVGGTSNVVLPGDIDANGEVNFSDFLAFVTNFAKVDVTGGAADGDFDADGDVDFIDFLTLARNFGKTLADL